MLTVPAASLVVMEEEATVPAAVAEYAAVTEEELAVAVPEPTPVPAAVAEPTPVPAAVAEYAAVAEPTPVPTVAVRLPMPPNAHLRPISFSL